MLGAPGGAGAEAFAQLGQQGGLAGAALAEQRHPLTLVEGEGEPGQHQLGGAPLAVAAVAEILGREADQRRADGGAALLALHGVGSQRSRPSSSATSSMGA